MDKDRRVGVLLWSIALPGFGQLLNGKYIKGLLFIGLEFMVNLHANLNEVIVFSFIGDMSRTIAHTDYEWMMFYPCLYMFALWDAYRDAGGGTAPFIVVPFVFGAYFGTVGIIYSSTFQVAGYWPGPVWLGIAGLIVGVGSGLIARLILIRTWVAKN